MTLEEVQSLTTEELDAVRLRGMTDLFFLCTEILGYDFTEEVHREACDLFVKKDPFKPLEEWSPIKDRLYVDPREHYKTTLDVGDMVQYIIAYPDVRIGLWSGEDTLAKQIMNMVKNHFKLNEVFKAVYYEHAVDPKDKKYDNIYEFTTPARTNWRLREPTLSVSTIKSVSTGNHFNVIKYDDVVTPQNSETKEQLALTIDRVRQTHPLLIVGGYRDFIGTRYDFSDMYGWILDTKDETWKTLVRQAYEPSVDREGNPTPPNKDSKVLFTVNRAGKKAFDYKELLKRYKEMGPRLFGCQYLNNPQWGETSAFPEKLIREQSRPLSMLPLTRVDHMAGGQIFRNMAVFILWDLAFSKKKQANYTVGIAIGFDQKGNVYILDMVRGRYSADEFVYQFFLLYRKWAFFMGRIGIEEVAGALMIEPTLRAQANSMRVALPLDFHPIPRDASKQERILGLLPLLKQRKLWFNSEIPDYEQLIKEFTRFPRFTLDDIPDCCALGLTYQNNVDVQPPPHLMPKPFVTRTGSPLGFGLVG